MQRFEMIAIQPFSMGKREFKTALVTAPEEIFKISICYRPDIPVPMLSRACFGPAALPGRSLRYE